MTTKQVQSFEEYVQGIQVTPNNQEADDWYYPLMTDGRKLMKFDPYAFWKSIGYSLSGEHGYNMPTFGVCDGHSAVHVDAIVGNGANGLGLGFEDYVCFPKGCSFSESETDATLIYGEANASDYIGILNDKFNCLKTKGIAVDKFGSTYAYVDSLKAGSSVLYTLSAEECYFSGIGRWEEDGEPVVIFSKLLLRKGCGITWQTLESENKVFNTAGGATDIYSKTEIDTKLESLSGQGSSDLQKYLHCETITDSQGNQVEAIKPKCIDYGVWVSGCFNFDEYFTPFPKNYIVWNKVALSEYGHDSTDKTGCVKMVGTYAMDTACVKDLYVKNLHSSLQSNTMDEIKVDSILPKSEGEYANIYLGSGITFHGNPNYSLIKYEEIDLSQYGFGNRTINGHTCWGDFLFGNDIYATSNIYAWDVQLCQDGGTVKSLKETIAKLEARIAALESK